MGKVAFLLLLFALVSPSPTAAAKTFLLVMDVLSFAMDMTSYIQSFIDDSSSQPDHETVKQLMEELSQRMEAANTELLRNIRLELKLDTLETIVMKIYSSLQDLKRVLNATSAENFQTYGNVFIQHFNDHGVLVQIRWLRHLLTYTAPGMAHTLLDLFAESHRCSLTPMKQFKQFYLNLVSDAAALHFAYVSLSGRNLSSAEDEWRHTGSDVLSKLDKWLDECKSKFISLAREDFLNAHDAVLLSESNKERFPWMRCDIFFYADIGTHQFHFYQQNVKNTSFADYSGNKNKYEAFGPREQLPIWNVKEVNQKLQSQEQHFRSAVSGEKDSEAAKHIGESVIAYLQTQGHSIENIIVFFENGQFPVDSIFIDKDSPVAQVSVTNVKLRYCYSSGVQCWFSEDGFGETSTGTFRVFVYPTEEVVKPSEVIIGAASHLYPMFCLVLTQAILIRLV